MKTILITLIVFYWTISRHEGSHALMARLEGADVHKVRLLPGIHEDRGFYFAYVEHSEGTSWLTEAAPFFSDVFLLFIASALLIWKPGTRYYYTIVFLGFISPIIDLIYNYQGGFWRNGTDVSDLIDLLPGSLVHITFGFAIFISVFALVAFGKRRKKLMRGLPG